MLAKPSILLLPAAEAPAQHHDAHARADHGATDQQVSDPVAAEPLYVLLSLAGHPDAHEQARVLAQARGRGVGEVSLNYAGLALMLVGIAFAVGELFFPAYRSLGIGGAIAFVIAAQVRPATVSAPRASAIG